MRQIFPWWTWYLHPVPCASRCRVNHSPGRSRNNINSDVLWSTAPNLLQAARTAHSGTRINPNCITFERLLNPSRLDWTRGEAAAPPFAAWCANRCVGSLRRGGERGLCKFRRHQMPRIFPNASRAGSIWQARGAHWWPTSATRTVPRSTTCEDPARNAARSTPGMPAPPTSCR